MTARILIVGGYGVVGRYLAVQLVVSCAPMDEPTLLQAAIARGCDYLDIGERTAFLKRARVLYEDARKAGVAAVIGMGLMPGIVNVMARSGRTPRGYRAPRDCTAAEH